MDPQSNSEDPTTQSVHDDQQEAELFAASAAEGAITDRKTASDSDDLHQLTGAIEQASLKEIETEQSSQAPSTDESHSDAAKQPDRILSKEELVEEALNCPCIASMRDGPCGDPFIAAYKCFLQSETEPKGMDCMDQFKGMQTCMAEHPEEYNLDDDDGEDADPFVAHKTTPAEDEHFVPTDSIPDKRDANTTSPTASASS